MNRAHSLVSADGMGEARCLYKFTHPLSIRQTLWHVWKLDSSTTRVWAQYEEVFKVNLPLVLLIPRHTNVRLTVKLSRPTLDLSEADSIIQHQLSLRNPCKASLLLTHRDADCKHKKKNWCKFQRLIKVHSLNPPLTQIFTSFFFFFVQEHKRVCTLIFVAFNSLCPCWIKHYLSMAPEVDTRASRPSVSLETYCNVSEI